MTDSGRTEYPGDSMRAVRKVARSERFKPLFTLLITAIAGTIGGGVGWIAKLMSDNSELVALRTTVEASTRSNTELREFLMHEFLDPTETPGKTGRLVKLERDQRIVFREMLRVRALAIATETPRTREQKRNSALNILDSYDNLLKDSKFRGDPIAAYVEANEKVSIR